MLFPEPLCDTIFLPFLFNLFCSKLTQTHSLTHTQREERDFIKREKAVSRCLLLLCPQFHEFSLSGSHKMPNLEPPLADTVLENSRSHRHSVTGSTDVSISDDSSDDQSWIRDDSAALSEEVDLESGDLEMKVHLGKLGRDCRICHLGLEGNGGGEDLGVLMELGCSCKGDLGAAHKQCAETWFKIKGNTACEICGATALNVAGEQTNETNTVTAIAPTAPMIRSESQTFWHSRRVMNFLLACMVFAFVISWLFHFKILS